MEKKFFVRRARLVKGKKWWYIDFQRVHREHGTTTRHRLDFDLNEIDDLTLREAVGLRLAKYLDAMAPAVLMEDERRPGKPLETAVNDILALKLGAERTNSHKVYKTIVSKFLSWAKANKYHTEPAEYFTRKQAIAFFDFMQREGNYRAATVKNYLTHLKVIWSEMVTREDVKENVWREMKTPKQQEKRRRTFTPDERRIIAAEIEATDYWLFRAVLLQFFCYIRPVELVRLRFKNFDLGAGLVTVEGHQSKTWKKRVCTLPKSILHYFIDGKFDRKPANYFVFGLVEGKDMGPSTAPLNDGRMYKRHRRILERLQASGKLHDISGLSWYSWKDTGISDHARKTSPMSTKDQAGHKALDMTLIYYHQETEIGEYRNLENDLFT